MRTCALHGQLLLLLIAPLHAQSHRALGTATSTGTHMPLSVRDPVRVCSITLRSGCDSHFSSAVAATAAVAASDEAAVSPTKDQHACTTDATCEVCITVTTRGETSHWPPAPGPCEDTDIMYGTRTPQ